MWTIRRRATAMALTCVLAFAVTVMHTGLMPHAPAPHHVAVAHAHDVSPAASASAEHAHVDKQTVHAVHDHEAHDCAGTVVVHKSVGAAPLVAVLPRSDGAASPAPAERAAAARGPPPWTVLDLSELCLLRV